MRITDLAENDISQIRALLRGYIEALEAKLEAINWSDDPLRVRVVLIAWYREEITKAYQSLDKLPLLDDDEQTLLDEADTKQEASEHSPP